ncbi:dihydrodipicolinate synthase family protein [Azospirillum agricola]|uniref:dihydrodipicolinate synthase family protein n=1 Tax=Azospirillum agricola TaxID=1720247 RepID=UPI000A0F20CD|nr:dihydrodipicolinate synthase family protein [Azospirillum agricola]SMH44401.1 Dihydrodipicolinate synthase/N-acetylneuraminate lyase [Azospirillum lipoferum]
MKTTPVTRADLERSVIAVPPLARNADLSLNREENRKLVQHLERGGVSTLLYGGNANLYNIGTGEFPELLALLRDIAGPETWVIPSIGPDYGKALDQAAILREFDFPTAMMLPMAFGATPAGIATAIARVAERAGRPLTAYVKSDNYLEPKALAALVRDGAVCSVKYAVVRDDPSKDEYLQRILDAVDARYIVSGIGERPVLAHLPQFGLTGFTSGSVCVAPNLSMAILRALTRGDVAEAAALRERFLPLEDLRDGISPIRVLHEAVTLSGVADMGPMLPMLSNLTDEGQLAAIRAAASTLLEADRAFAG